MANNVWRGDAQAVAQVVTVVVTADDAATTYTITINSKTVSVLGAGTGVNDTATALQEALAASTIPEFQEVTWTVSTATITGTASTPGVPFTATSSVSGGTGTIGSVTQTVANSGPNVWSTPANWTLGYVPQSTLSTPVQAAASAVAGGSLVDTTQYYWVITAINQNGETVKSNQQTLVIAAPNQTAHLSWAQIPGATGYKVYRSTVTNTYTTPALVTTITGGSTLTYNDTGTAVGAGAPPGSSTAVGDDVYVQNSTSSILYDLNQSTLAILTLWVDSTFTGYIGLPRYSTTGGYLEYRPTYLAIGITTVHNGLGNGSGSGRVKIDCGTGQTTWNIYTTGSSADQGIPAVLLLGTHASNVLNCQQGTIGVAFEAPAVSTIATLRIGFQSSQQTDANVVLGNGCTLTTIQQNGGFLQFASSLTTLTMYGGTTTVLESANITTLQLQEGTIYYQSNGTITTATVGTNGVLDFSRDPRTRTVTNMTVTSQSTMLDPNKTVTFTNPFQVLNCSLSELSLDLGQSFYLQRS